MQNDKKTKIIFAIDEVGRGPLAGPVLATAITGPAISNFKFPIFKQNERLKIKDSKKLSQKQREEIYIFLKKNSDFVWATGRVGEKIIDKMNILNATKLAMEKAVLALEKKIGKKAQMILIDGNFAINVDRDQQSIVRGDEKIPLISLASVVAKIERDRLMMEFHKKYPMYGFDRHKGYGTKEHYQMIACYGSCAIHRQSFRLGI